jgi:hypothetical protein
MPNTSAWKWSPPPTTSCSASPIAPMSAAMLIVLATSSRPTIVNRNQPGMCSRKLAAMPLPDWRPMRALTSWIATMNGTERNTVHSTEVPNCAPAWV